MTHRWPRWFSYCMCHDTFLQKTRRFISARQICNLNSLKTRVLHRKTDSGKKKSNLTWIMPA
uniref:Uncharacterized protein n=1 Tax=Anguilla anguilla TaxID=7936 RepID=A0A0E9PNC9_ANGAN